MCLASGNKRDGKNHTTLRERLRRGPLLKVINSPNLILHPSHASWILAALMKGQKTGEFIDLRVTYKHGDAVDFGRLYASYPSLQNCPGYIRRLCSYGLYVDIDIKNAFPTILAQLAEQHGLSAPLLNAYVDDREGWINAVCADVAVSFKQVKNAVLIAMHGGNYKQEVENKAHDKLTRFAAEVKQLAADFSKLTTYKKLWEDAQVAAKSKAEKKNWENLSGRIDERVWTNPRGTFISWICQIQEAKTISAVKAYFEEEPQNLQVGCVVFGGLMPYWQGADSVPEELLQGASDRAFKETGIRVEFVQKSLDRAETRGPGRRWHYHNHPPADVQRRRGHRVGSYAGPRRRFGREGDAPLRVPARRQAAWHHCSNGPRQDAHRRGIPGRLSQKAPQGPHPLHQ